MNIIHKTVALMALNLLLLSSVAFAAEDHDDHGHEHETEASYMVEEHDDLDDHDEELSDSHEEHGEDKVVIDDKVAKSSGIKLEKASAGMVAETSTLTGRIMLNRDTTVHVRGRFAGLVKSVHVKWGETVKKGQLLARVESNESLNIYNVVSPIDGVVLERNTSAGDLTGDGALFQIADLSNVWAEFHVFPKDLDRIHEGLPVEVAIVGNHKKAPAKIDLMLPTADKLSQTVVAVAVIDNKEGIWRPGMTISGRVITQEKLVNVVVKPSALQTLEGRQVIFVQHDGAYEARTVVTGLSGPMGVEILSGVDAGEHYVSEGSFIVKADIGKESAEHAH